MSVNLHGELGVTCEVGSVSPFLFRLLKKGELLITCTELFLSSGCCALQLVVKFCELLIKVKRAVTKCMSLKSFLALSCSYRSHILILFYRTADYFVILFFDF